jgi:glucosamine--fructose-6-phosphate aminotransferase (isomerizing)
MIKESLSIENKIQIIAKDFLKAKGSIFLGRGASFPIALEGALKLKELSYLHAEGYPAGEMKHGPLALIEDGLPVIVIAPKDKYLEKTMSNMQEVMARAGKVLLLSSKSGLDLAADGVWATLTMPDAPELITPIIYAIPAQLLAYHTAVAKGTDVDQPRNLAKSVTVE